MRVAPFNQAFLRPHRYRNSFMTFIVAASIMISVLSEMASADSVEAAKIVLELGATTGKAVWVSHKNQQSISASEPDKYLKLANELKAQIDLGRAGSTLVQASFNFYGGVLGYAAYVDPEPFSKVTFGIAALGAQKAGELVGNHVLENTQKETQAILAQGLKNGDLTEADLKLRGESLAKKIGTIRLGQKTLMEALKDDQQSLNMVFAQSEDLAINVSSEALRQVDAVGDDVDKIKEDISASRKNLEKYQVAIAGHLDVIENHLGSLDSAIKDSNIKLNALKDKVKGHDLAIKSLAQISYAGWSVSQKLQAARSGLLPDLSNEQRSALISSLESDHAREQLIGDLQKVASDFGNMAAIANDIGLPPKVTEGLKAAQMGANAIASFAQGNILGGVAGITSLAGLGKPDSGSERHKAMMAYLGQEFGKVNEKLTKVIELQQKTLVAINDLAIEQNRFRREVLMQLDRIENAVLNNTQITRAILRGSWNDCDAFVNTLGDRRKISGKNELMQILTDPHKRSTASGCYGKLFTFLDANVLGVKWQGEIISAESFPDDTITSLPLLKSWKVYSDRLIIAHSAASQFVYSALLNNANTSPARNMARMSLPVSNANLQEKLENTFNEGDVGKKLDSYDCSLSYEYAISMGFEQFLCPAGLGKGGSPRNEVWQTLLIDAPLLGPLTYGVIETGIVVASISGLAVMSPVDKSLNFVAPNIINSISTNTGNERLRKAIAEGNGKYILKRLMLLADTAVLQQSITYGDYAAKLVEHVLYDPQTKSLNADLSALSDQKTKELKFKAIHAMRVNPVLARNVVMLAARHAISDSLGGTKNAQASNYKQTYYQLALFDFIGPQACGRSTLAREKLTELFPKWNFQYVASMAQKQKDPSLNACPDQVVPDLAAQPSMPDLGGGLVTQLDDFYVQMPSPMTLAGGLFEQPESLILALVYRDRVNQAIVDHNIAQTAKKIAGAGDGGEFAFSLLTEGWDVKTEEFH